MELPLDRLTRTHAGRVLASSRVTSYGVKLGENVVPGRQHRRESPSVLNPAGFSCRRDTSQRHVAQCHLFSSSPEGHGLSVSCEALLVSAVKNSLSLPSLKRVSGLTLLPRTCGHHLRNWQVLCCAKGDSAPSDSAEPSGSGAQDGPGGEDSIAREGTAHSSFSSGGHADVTGGSGSLVPYKGASRSSPESGLSGAAHVHKGEAGSAVSGSGSDWRAFRARLVASEGAEVRARPGDGGLGVAETLSEAAGDLADVFLGDAWAHALYAPEKGCLLIASELLHGYNFFQRSVILLLGVGTGPSDGPYGIALNKPFPRTVGQVDSILPGMAATFGTCQVHVGGPIGPRTVLLVHRHPGLDGHCEVLPGVFVAGLAGLSAATALVESGSARPEDFQVVLGYAGWGKEQLRQEIAQGWWYVAACSKDAIFDAQKRSKDGNGDRLWKSILSLMGGEYAEVGNRSTGGGA